MGRVCCSDDHTVDSIQMIENFIAIAQGDYGPIGQFFLFFNMCITLPLGGYIIQFAVRGQIKLNKKMKKLQ